MPTMAERQDELVQFRADCARRLAELDEKAGNGPLDEDTQAEWDQLATWVEEARNLEADIEARAKIMEAAKAQPAVIPGDDPDWAGPDMPRLDDKRGVKDPWNLDEVRAYAADRRTEASNLRGRLRTCVEQAVGFSDERRQAITELVDGALGADEDDSPGVARTLRHMIVTSSPDYQRAFARGIRAVARGTHDPESETVLSRAASLTDAAGGFAIPQQLDPTLIAATSLSTNPIGAIARNVVATGDVWNAVTGTNVVWSYDAEAAEVSDDTPTWAQPSIPIHMARGFVPFSIEIGGDYPGFTQDLERLFNRGLNNLESAAFATGTGTGQPTGIVTALTGGASEVASAAADTLAWGDVTGLNNVIASEYRGRGSWLAEARIISEIREDAIATGYEGSFIDPAGDLPGRLLGHPVYEVSDMDGVINAAAENYVLVLGDFFYYVVARRIGMSIEFIPHLFHTANNLPSGQRGLFAWVRHGADSVLDNAFRMLNVT